MGDNGLEDRLEKLRQAIGLRYHLNEANDSPEENEFLPVNSKDDTNAGDWQQPSEPLPFSTSYMNSRPDQSLSDEPKYNAMEEPAMGELTTLTPLDCSNFRYGEPCDEVIDFCPWKVICTYPDFFIGKTNKPRAQPFFDKILEGRVWDFFYLYDPEKAANRPHLLVPTVQFESFLTSINRELGTALAIPEGVNQDRFYIRFDYGGIPRPRYLKRSRNKKTLSVEEWPGIHKADVEAFSAAAASHKSVWRSNIEKMLPKPGHRDKQKSSERRAAQRKADRERMLCEAKEYLHLKGDDKQDVVLICMDIEAIEIPPNPISEVGIAILDTRKLHEHKPGPCGRDWWDLIEAHHLRVKEYSATRNYRFVQGCPDKFDFGTSTFPTRIELVKSIEATLTTFVNQGRNLVFVGHDTQQDVKYLSNIGFKVMALKNMLGQLDTKEMHQAWRNSDQGRALRSVLGDLCIPSMHLHNAGNDAVFTLRALVGVAIEDIRQREAESRGEEYSPALSTVE